MHIDNTKPNDLKDFPLPRYFRNVLLFVAGVLLGSLISEPLLAELTQEWQITLIPNCSRQDGTVISEANCALIEYQIQVDEIVSDIGTGNSLTIAVGPGNHHVSANVLDFWINTDGTRLESGWTPPFLFTADQNSPPSMVEIILTPTGN